MQIHSVMAIFYFKCNSSINLELSFLVPRGQSSDTRDSTGMSPSCGQAGGLGSGDFWVREGSGHVCSIQTKHTAQERGFYHFFPLLYFVEILKCQDGKSNTSSIPSNCCQQWTVESVYLSLCPQNQPNKTNFSRRIQRKKRIILNPVLRDFTWSAGDRVQNFSSEPEVKYEIELFMPRVNMMLFIPSPTSVFFLFSFLQSILWVTISSLCKIKKSLQCPRLLPPIATSDRIIAILIGSTQ